MNNKWIALARQYGIPEEIVMSMDEKRLPLFFKRLAVVVNSRGRVNVVRCPNCGNIRGAITTKRVRCFKCGRYFNIVSKKCNRAIYLARRG